VADGWHQPGDHVGEPAGVAGVSVGEQPDQQPELLPDPNGGGTEFVVTNAIAMAAANGWLSVTFGLRGKDEANDNFWRRFDLNPVLRVDGTYPLPAGW
jgi:hypothetical protein